MLWDVKFIHKVYLNRYPKPHCRLLKYDQTYQNHSYMGTKTKVDFSLIFGIAIYINV